MRVYENKNWNVEMISIKQDFAGNYKKQYFVDDKSGKNWRVFDSKNDAVKWLSRR